MTDPASSTIVTEHRGLGDFRATGEVELRSEIEAGNQHHSYAASLAWRTIARSAFAAGDLETAAEAAERGIDELGLTYLTAEIDDDTELKLRDAEAARDEGNLHGAARAMIAILGDRQEQFRIGHEGDVR